MEQLEGKIALITGGSKGIGLATAQLLAANGAKIVITGRNQKSLEEAKRRISADTLCVQGDVSNLSDLDRLFAEVKQKYSGIDILFANAGAIAGKMQINDITEKAFDQIVSVNYKGTFFTLQKAVPYLNEGASLIINASVSGTATFYYSSLYSSTKAAVIHLAKTFAADLASKKIRVNSISPGYVKTAPWQQGSHTSIFQELCSEVPLENRFGYTEEIAKAVLFLASSASSYITAQNIIIDGGLTAFYRQSFDDKI